MSLPPRLKSLCRPLTVTERPSSLLSSCSVFSPSPTIHAPTFTDNNSMADDSFDSFEFDSYPLSQSVPTSFCKQNLPLFLAEPTMATAFYNQNAVSGISSPVRPAYSVPSNASMSSISTSTTSSARTSSHIRNAGSTSSIELSAPGTVAMPLPLPSMAVPAEMPAMPPQVPSGPSHSKSASKRQLPDVIEEPFERDDFAMGVNVRDSWASSSYDNCWPDPCLHMNDDSIIPCDIDYDAVMSDNEYVTSGQKMDQSSESALGNITSRIGSRFPSIQRWRSGRSRRRPALILNPSNDPNFDAYPAAASSRSSSLSTPSHPRLYQLESAHIPGSPAMSFCESNESILMSAVASLPPTSNSVDLDNETSRKSIARDRSQALTPLLPPLMNETIARPPPSQGPSQPTSPTMQSPFASPLASPLTAPSMDEQLQSAMKHASMAPSQRSGNTLSPRPSVSSFRPSPAAENSLNFSAKISEEEQDEWSVKLGHANFTIHPKPYQPVEPSQEALFKFREDWQLARKEYTKHLTRTGENYGETSSVFTLTGQKWDAIETEWRKNHQEMINRVQAYAAISAIHINRLSNMGSVAMAPSSSAQSTTSRFSQLSLSRSHSLNRGRTRSRSRAESGGGISLRTAMPPLSPTSHPTSHPSDTLNGAQLRELEEAIPKDVPRLIDPSGKFPSRGDEDIVGPMVRDAVMIRSPSEERKIEQLSYHGHHKFWRNLLDKMKK